MARFYSNPIARFTSPDPIPGSLANPQSLNRYAYTLGDPVNLVDPSGLDSYPICFETENGPEVCLWWNTGGGPPRYAPLQDTPDVSGHGGGNSSGTTIKSVLRKIGNYIPTICGAGTFNYGGIRLSGAVASVGLYQIRSADTGSGYAQGPFTDITFGEVIQGGYGYALYNTGETEHFLFGGVGGDVGVVKASASLYGSHVSGDSVLKNQFGINFDGGFLIFGGGTGTGINTNSLTGCFDSVFSSSQIGSGGGW